LSSSVFLVQCKKQLSKPQKRYNKTLYKSLDLCTTFKEVDDYTMYTAISYNVKTHMTDGQL